MNDKLQELRKPFPDHQISYLPKGGTKLAYVGHAALTDRLLDVDPGWTWEPLAMSPHGLPVMDDLGGMWIRLTVCGVTRLGYGHAGNKQGGDAIKEIIGDALRNAAMRFGAALELWHKGDLHLDAVEIEDSSKAVLEVTDATINALLDDIVCSNTIEQLKESFDIAIKTVGKNQIARDQIAQAKDAQKATLKGTP
jgi:hypothetical protein